MHVVCTLDSASVTVVYGMEVSIDSKEGLRGRVGLMRRIQPAIYCALPKSRLGSRIRLRFAHQYMVS